MTNSKNTVINSSILMISASWLAKTLGLVSTIILARLLTPSDFGLVAIVMLVIYFFTIFSETGCKQYLLSLDKVTDKELNTAWTLNLLSKLLISVVLVFTAPYSANFFAEPALTNSLLVAAFIPLINGLENPAIYLAKRDFNYRGIFKLNLFTKIVSFISTISLAYYLKSHWALIYGTLIHFSLMTIGSYFIVPFKPAFSLLNIKKQWDYSKWIFTRGLVGYARAKIDTFILAKSFVTAELGLFNVAKEFAMLLYEQVAIPLADIVMTSIQKVSAKTSDTRLVVEKFSTLLASFLLPAVVGLSVLSTQIIVVVLGEQWSAAGPLLSALSILGFSTSLVIVLSSTLNSLSKTKLIFKLDLITTGIILVTLILARNLDIYTFALIRGGLGFVVLLGYLAVLRVIIKLSIRKYLFNIIPALIASIGMIFTLQLSLNAFPDNNLINLLIHILSGVISYLLMFGLILRLLYKQSESLVFIYESFLRLITRILIANKKPSC